jgi:ABC-type lipoprotein export system ATPase subunit
MSTPPGLLSILTAQRRHLLLVSENESTISQLTAMVVQSDSPIGVISDDFPFLANLSVLENIVLGCMYHKAMSLLSCRETIQDFVDALGLNESLDQRSQLLSRPKLLKMHLLRCMANGSTFVFLPMPSRLDCDILHRAAESLDRDVFLWIGCLSNDQDVYTSLEYPVIDLNSPQ